MINRECIARGDFVHHLCEEYIFKRVNCVTVDKCIQNNSTDTQHKARIHLKYLFILHSCW